MCLFKISISIYGEKYEYMKVLWITNIMLPPLCERLNLPIPVIGGWMYSLAKSLILVPDNKIKLAIATIYQGNVLQRYEIDNVVYYLLPLRGKSISQYNKHFEPLWKNIEKEFSPDIVHLHGTEFAHGLPFLRACPQVKSVVSIQGLVSVIGRYYLEGLSFRDILGNITFRDVIRWNNLWQQKKDFVDRGGIEKEIIQLCSHVIGRTSWDKAHVKAIHPDICYHFCNETLRDEFYKYKWEYSSCEKHSIFLSQAGYPIKGLHQVLKALPFVIKKYPDVKVYIAGVDVRRVNTLKERITRSGYGQYLLNLIKSLNLEKYVEFTGPLNEQEICKKMLRSNIFLCPSSIENSPNSLGEAQLLGLPCIASYVGGIPDMIPNNLCGRMYRYEEVEMLAELILEVFEESMSFDNTEMRKIALQRHSSSMNQQCLLEIYNEIVNCNI